MGGIISIYDIPTPSNTGQSVNGTIIDPALIDSIEPSVIQIDANTTPFTGIEDLPGISLDNTNNTTVDNNIITIPTNNTTPILDIINKNNVFIDNNIITKFNPVVIPVCDQATKIDNYMTNTGSTFENTIKTSYTLQSGCVAYILDIAGMTNETYSLNAFDSILKSSGIEECCIGVI